MTEKTLKRYPCYSCQLNGAILVVKVDSNPVEYRCSLGKEDCSIVQAYKDFAWLLDTNLEAHKKFFEKLGYEG